MYEIATTKHPEFFFPEDFGGQLFYLFASIIVYLYLPLLSP